MGEDSSWPYIRPRHALKCRYGSQPEADVRGDAYYAKVTGIAPTMQVSEILTN